METRGTTGGGVGVGVRVGGGGVISVFFFFLFLTSQFVISESGRDEITEKGIVLEEGNLEPWTKGLLKLAPVASGPVAMAPDAKFPLVLAEKRTRRPDILNSFKIYKGGWDITNKHYWASVAFTGAAGVILSALWIVIFGISLGAHFCCRWRMGKEKGSNRIGHVSLVLLLIFTCAASTGCILLSIGQGEFHHEALGTLDYVVNQSDFTVQILRNVTNFLYFAKTINVDTVHLPSDIQDQVDKLSGDLGIAASALSEKTSENSRRINQAISDVRCTLIAVASLMLVLAIFGFLMSILGIKHAVYIFVISGWLLVAVTFVLFGAFVIIESAATDTCKAMNEWVRYPQAETALSSILPCVNEHTTNRTLYQSKEVIRQLVNVVNTAISSIANDDTAYHYNQSGPPLPYLCSPYDAELHDQQCRPQEVSIANASLVWQNYTCTISNSVSCISVGRITPEIYHQLVVAVNVSYALYHYTPLLLNLQDCKFVRDTFDTITTRYCPHLERDLRVVCAGLALIAIGVLLCHVVWIFYANRPRREEVFAQPSGAKIASASTFP
ncbi:uncharacterized protein [Typha latifolia]|uniref:uncharacterized protein n=1 Tax=Typha latifolia TaxID=4733 RepID=UPI003C2EB3B3